MATKSASLGPRKRKLSNKVTTNGDPLEARKRNKTLSAVKKGLKAAPTKKTTPAVPSSETATGTSKTPDGSDNDSDLPEVISVDDIMEESDAENNLEAAAESAETELGRKSIS